MRQFSRADIAVVVILGASFAFTAPSVVRNLTTPPTHPNVPSLLVGTRFELAGVELHRSKGTLAIILDTPCLECPSNTQAYNDLIKLARAHTIQVLLIAPTATIPAALGIHVTGTTSVARNPRELGLGRVPSIVWLSDDGTLVQRWQGVLTPSGRQQVDDILHQLPIPPPTLSGDINNDLLSNLVGDRRLGTRLVFVDVRDRGEYSKEHREDALNIPLDELSVRIRHEVDSQSIVLINCAPITAFTCDLAKSVFAGQGYRSVASVGRSANKPEQCPTAAVEDTVVAVLDRP